MLSFSLEEFLTAYSGIYEDIGLVIAGILVTILIVKRNSQAKESH